VSGDERAAHEWERTPASILILNQVDIAHSQQLEIVTEDIPMPALDYVSQTPSSVSVTYTDMPAGAQVVFVNKVSGATTPAQGGALSKGGSGSAEIPISGVSSGEYYLQAQNSGQSVAQTVVFYIA
jgi:hypothetical protein